MLSVVILKHDEDILLANILEPDIKDILSDNILEAR